MTVRTNFDEANDLYELGDDFDGVFIPFVTIPGPQVRGRVATVQEFQSGGANAAQPGGAAGGGAVATATADEELAALREQVSTLTAENQTLRADTAATQSQPVAAAATPTSGAADAPAAA